MSGGERSALFVGYVGVALVLSGLLSVLASERFEGWVVERAQVEMGRQGVVLGMLIEASHGDGSEATQPGMDELAQRLGGMLGGVRVEIWDEAGVLRGDSWGVRGAGATGSSEGGEVWRGAGERVAWRARGREGWVRSTLRDEELEEVLWRGRLLILLMVGLSMGGVGVLSGVSAHLMSSSLRELVERVQREVSSSRQEVGLGASELLVSSSVSVVRSRSVEELVQGLERAVAELASERDRFRVVLESMDEAVVALDSEQRVRLMNRAAQQMFAASLALFDGEGVLDQRVTVLLKVPSFLDLLERAGQGKGSVAELTLPGPPSRRVVAHVNPQSGGAGGVLLVLHDVTEVRKLETVRRDFVANVSHELRTPVSVIMLNSETLLSDEALLAGSSHARRFVEAMHRNAERLTRLISDLLDISRLEAGKFRLELEPVSVFGAALRVLDSLEDRAQAKEQELDIDIPLDLFVFADAKALDQMLFNLVDNATKYAPRGGKVLVRARTYEAEPPLPGGSRAHVRIEVCDDGPGLAAKHRPRIFERFYRADEGRSRDEGGTGLGLSIVKHLSEAMGGRVGVMGNDSRGSIFWVQVPQAMQGEPPSVEVAHAVEVISKESDLGDEER